MTLIPNYIISFCIILAVILIFFGLYKGFKDNKLKWFIILIFGISSGIWGFIFIIHNLLQNLF